MAPALLHTLIHRSAWKKNSRKFAVASSPARIGASGIGTRPRGFLPTIVDTLATPVAWICCERLRLATSRLPENFSPRRTHGGLCDPGDRRHDHQHPGGHEVEDRADQSDHGDRLSFRNSSWFQLVSTLPRRVPSLGGYLKIGPIQTGARPPRCIEKRNAGREITPSPRTSPL